MIGLILGDSVVCEKIVVVVISGGIGVVCQVFELIKLVNLVVKVYVFNLIWLNYVLILKYVGIEVVFYCYFDMEICGVDFDGMFEDLGKVVEGDVVLLYGCCYNLMGVNLNLMQWQQVVDLINEKNLLVMVDIVYQGFGDGLEEDVQVVCFVVFLVVNVLIVGSCFKNFGIYCECMGILMVILFDVEILVV